MDDAYQKYLDRYNESLRQTALRKQITGFVILGIVGIFVLFGIALCIAGCCADSEKARKNRARDRDTAERGEAVVLEDQLPTYEELGKLPSVTEEGFREPAPAYIP